MRKRLVFTRVKGDFDQNSSSSALLNRKSRSGGLLKTGVTKNFFNAYGWLTLVHQLLDPQSPPRESTQYRTTSARSVIYQASHAGGSSPWLL